jgi:LPS-assembly protein
MGRTEPGLEVPWLSERLDFHPEVTLRPKPFLGFHVTPTAGLRATRYGTSLRADREPLHRVLGEFSVDLRPPSFDKIFSKPLWGYRFKHVIEPDVRYRLVRARDPESLQDVMRFDYVDIFAETNEIEYSLTNSLFFRKDTAAGQAERPQARELISWRLSQKYYFDPTFGGALDPGTRAVFDPTISLTGFAFAQGRRLSPIVSVLKFAPFSHYDTELRADISPSGGGVLNAGITSHLRHGPVGLSFTDFFINRTAALSTPLAPTGSLSGLPSFHLLRAVASYGEVNRKGFSGAFGLDFNFAQRIAHQIVNQVSYNFGCFALDFEYRRFALGDLRRENQFRVALSLANVGTFGNLKPRERLY